MKRYGYKDYVIGFIIITAVWYAAAITLSLSLVPLPLKVFLNISLKFSSNMLIHLIFSLGRVLEGTLLGVIIGVPIGICMGYYDKADKCLSPIVYFLYPVPKIALLPLFMLFLGLGEASKIGMILIIVLFQIIVAARDAVKNISKENYYSLYSLGAGKLSIIREVVLPVVQPDVITSVRVTLGTAVSVLFFTETFGTEYGMGYYIMDSWMRVNYVDMYSGIVILSLMGVGLFICVDLLEKWTCKWKRI
jgi:NitT/TauT family transport system permease protein